MQVSDMLINVERYCIILVEVLHIFKTTTYTAWPEGIRFVVYRPSSVFKATWADGNEVIPHPQTTNRKCILHCVLTFILGVGRFLVFFAYSAEHYVRLEDKCSTIKHSNIQVTKEVLN